MQAPNSLTFVIPVRNDAERLRRCLATIRAASPEDVSVSVVVVDNGSSDHSVEVAADSGAEVVVMPGRPVAELRNEGAARATGDVLAFVDADHELGATWVRAALDGLAESGAVGIGALCHAPSPGTWVQRAYDRFRARPARLADLEWLGAGNLAVRADAFRAIGGFDTSLETCEDVDLCNRLRARGGRLVAEPAMHNVHLGDPTTLRAVFLGELWRGRDNFRVTMRGPLTLRALPSLMIPVVTVAATAVAVGLAIGTGQLRWLALPPSLLGAATTLRVSRMSRSPRDSFLSMVAGNTAVALVYEIGRALALLVRVSHATRRDDKKRRS